MTEIKVHGLLAKVNKELVNLYFQYSKKTWIPQKKKSKEVKYSLGTILDKDLYGVGYGAIAFLKQNNPEFARKVKISEFESVKSWKPLDLSLLGDLNIEYRKVQLDCLKSLQNKIVGNIVLPMSTGKTAILLSTAYMVTKQNQNVLFTSPTLKTQDNFIEEANKLGIKNVVSYDQIRRLKNLNESGLIIVANSTSFNTDAREELNQNVLNSITTLLTDEAHNWSRSGWNEMLLHLPNLHRCFGFSATSISTKEEKSNSFVKMDYKAAFAASACGPVIFRADVDDIKEHIDVPILIEIPFQWDLAISSKLNKVNNWSKLKAEQESNQERNEKLLSIIKVLEKHKRFSLIPINNKKLISEHISNLNSKLSIAWLGNGVVYDYKENKIPNEGLKEKVTKGKYRNIFATNHLNEGFSLPVLDAMVYSEGKNKITVTQQSGRVIRQSNQTPVIINLVDNFGIYNHHANCRSREIEQYYKIKAIKLNSVIELDKYLEQNGNS